MLGYTHVGVSPWADGSLRRAPTVLGDGLPEVLVLLARNQADLLQGGQVLLGFRQVVDDEIGFAGVLVRAAMTGIELQRPLVVLERQLEAAGVAIRIAEVILEVGVARVA